MEWLVRNNNHQGSTDGELDVEAHGHRLAARKTFFQPRAVEVHSSRSNIIGSTDSARRAGIHVATSPSSAMLNDASQYQRIAGVASIHDGGQHPAGAEFQGAIQPRNQRPAI